MKLLLLLFSIALSKDVEKLLTSQNQELEKVNAILHKKLANISKNFSVQIQEDYFYNKQRIISLISEYENESDDLVRIFLAEELLEYLRGIIEDANLLGGEIEGISTKKLLKAHQDLKRTTRTSKERYFAKESAGFYNELHTVLMQKHDNVKELQSENAKIYGKIESKLAEIKETNRNWENDSKKYDELNSELEKLKSNYNVHRVDLEESIQSQKGVKLTPLDQQDNEILNRQARNSDNSLVIEKLSAEISILASRFRFLTDTLQRYQSDLESKSTQLSITQSKFEDFSSAVRSETIFQVSNIAKSEDQLHNERNDLDQKARSLSAELNQCKTDAETLRSILKTKTIMIDENSQDLQETEYRQGVSLEQRGKEIDNLAIKNQELSMRILEFQQNLDESMKKVSEKATIIQDLQDKLRGNNSPDAKSLSFPRDKHA